MKKKFLRIIAVCAACLGIFAFAGCNKQPATGSGSGSGTEGSGSGTEGSGSGAEGSGSGAEGSGSGSGAEGSGSGAEGSGSGSGSSSGDSGSGGSSSSGSPDVELKVTVPEGGPEITNYSYEEMETAYVEWTEASEAAWYNVYYSPEGGGDWEKIDAPLVREYNGYFRADVLGLKADNYDLKVVPVDAEGTEDTDCASSVEAVPVIAHDRSGYAFVNGTASGAYNNDGTLKENAEVIYITDANKDSISLQVSDGKNVNTVTGLQLILDAQRKAGRPLAIRLIGSVTSPDVEASTQNKNHDTLLIKGDDNFPDLSVTLEGVGNDATANGWTLRITKSSNVEVRNIGFMNTLAHEPDGITLEDDKHVWVHNCDIFYGGAGSDTDQAKGDGALDTKTSTYITHSYNHFWDSGKSNLQGMKEESTSNYITYHHNWYDHSDSRHPRIRTCTVHVYNNYYDGNAKYGVGVTTGASAFVENNYFRSTTNMKPMMSADQGTDRQGDGTFSGETGGMIKSFGNVFVCPTGKLKLITQKDTADKTDIDCYEASSRDEAVPGDYVTKNGGKPYSNFDTAADMYKYTPDSAEDAKDKVERYAGRVGGGDFKWEFDDATEDGNYAIITGLKAALTAYKTSVVKVDGEDVPDGCLSQGSDSGSGGTEEDTPPAEIGLLPEDITEIIFSSTTQYPSGILITGSKEYSTTKGINITGITITIKSAVARTLTIHTNITQSGKMIKVNGTKKEISSDGTVTINLPANTEVKLTKDSPLYISKFVLS